MDIPIGQQNIRFPGYGLFWVANSITSAGLGFYSRYKQNKATECNLEFQRELEEARHLTEDTRMQEDIAFKRRLLAISRQYQQEMSAKEFIGKMKIQQFQKFIQDEWPLDAQLPLYFLSEIKKRQTNPSPEHLNVILLHAPLLPISSFGNAHQRDVQLYEQLEYLIVKHDIPCMGAGDVEFHKDACVKPDLKGGNANIMNIHFLMSQLPTLVISPRYYEGKLSFNGAVWEPQASRPFVRPLVTLDYEPMIAEKDEEYLNHSMKKIHATVSVTIGTVRDSYMMLTQGKTPTIDKWLNDGNHKEMRAIIQKTPELKSFIKQEMDSLLESLTQEKAPELLEAYSEVDIQRMRKQIESINIQTA